jgi:hypothetical protein
MYNFGSIDTNRPRKSHRRGKRKAVERGRQKERTVEVVVEMQLKKQKNM